MKVTIHKTTLELVQGDIICEETDAVVNSANETLLGGGGVDGSIHRAGGPSILEECRMLGGCRTGDAKITTGGNLKAAYVIHAVGPVYRGGTYGEKELLASCYRRSLEIASEKGLRSISFPSICTGAFGYPIREASYIALQTVIHFLREHEGTDRVRFVLFTANDLKSYEEALQACCDIER